MLTLCIVLAVLGLALALHALWFASSGRRAVSVVSLLLCGVCWVTALVGTVYIGDGRVPYDVAHYSRTDASAAAAGCTRHRGVSELNRTGVFASGNAVCRDGATVDLEEHREATRPPSVVAARKAQWARDRARQHTQARHRATTVAAIGGTWLILTTALFAALDWRDTRNTRAAMATEGNPR